MGIEKFFSTQLSSQEEQEIANSVLQDMRSRRISDTGDAGAIAVDKRLRKEREEKRKRGMRRGGVLLAATLAGVSAVKLGNNDGTTLSNPRNGVTDTAEIVPSQTPPPSLEKRERSSAPFVPVESSVSVRAKQEAGVSQEQVLTPEQATSQRIVRMLSRQGHRLPSSMEKALKETGYALADVVGDPPHDSDAYMGRFQNNNNWFFAKPLPSIGAKGALHIGYSEESLEEGGQIVDTVQKISVMDDSDLQSQITIYRSPHSETPRGVKVKAEGENLPDGSRQSYELSVEVNQYVAMDDYRESLWRSDGTRVVRGHMKRIPANTGGQEGDDVTDMRYEMEVVSSDSVDAMGGKEFRGNVWNSRAEKISDVTISPVVETDGEGRLQYRIQVGDQERVISVQGSLVSYEDGIEGVEGFPSQGVLQRFFADLKEL